MDPRLANEVSITDLFDQFIEASTMRNVLSTFHRILNYADLNPCEYNVFFPKLKRAVMTTRVRKNWKAKALFSKIDKKAAHRCYSNTKVPTPLGIRPSADQNNQSMNSQEHLDDSVSSSSGRQYFSNNALRHHNCLIIGSGPAGLRTAIELQLLGASKVVVVEKRSRFSRNNVLHLWPFVIDDLKSLGAKKFYGKFCAGSIDHISIRQLQLILLKICLMIGCDFRDSCSYLYLCPLSMDPKVKNGINGDSKIAHGSSDSVKSINSRCDLDTDDKCITEFVRVSDTLAGESKTNLDKEQDKAVNHFDDQAAAPNSEDNMSCDKLLANDESTSEADHPNPSAENQEIMQQHMETNKTPARGENLSGCRAHFESDYKIQEKELHSHEWDIIIGADGRRNTLSNFFPRKEFRGRLAIAITANFINRQTPPEAYVPEISGLSFIYNQDMFNALAFDTNIQLENICYYKDDTHYFVMTAKKKSLLERGVLINDYAATQDLLADKNVDRQALLKYAKDAAFWTTGLEPLDFALNHYGQEDCAMFDFTSMYAATNACKALRTKGGGLTLLGLVGDSLLEPFWPTGSGCARGFLSSFDASWMCRQWAVNRCAIIDHHNPLSTSKLSNHSPNLMGNNSKTIEPTTYNRMALSVMAERESIYRILAQTTSENLQQNYSLWTLNPHSRYPNLNRHLVIPAQIEHLLADGAGQVSISTNKNKLTPSTERNRRVKSPHSSASARKSPKKLKSAISSPLTQHRNLRSSSRLKHGHRSKSKHDINLDETYLEFERSYNNLADSENGPSQYLNYKRPDCDLYDDLFDPALSGTLPSSNNLLSLEARRARDIDECLRQRRQKTQLNVVRDQLINQLRGHSICRDEGSDMTSGRNVVSGGGAALFNEMRRRRELQSRGKENATKDVSSLTLLNSMRRCASFAERVKSFESKLSSSNESAPVTPKSPESVKNLPHFATLQELFVGNSTLNHDKISKSKIPIMKLSKDDWNVKCWEKRLAAYKQKASIGSSKSLNMPSTNDGHSYVNNSDQRRPEKQVAVFKDRIKEMAEKLETARNANHKLYSELKSDEKVEKFSKTLSTSNHPRRGWVSHLKQELTKGCEGKKNQQVMNPIAPHRTIKKLFANDNDDDDGIDINKHYDHLCINRPTNKYLVKNGGYSSHLVRTKYNSATSRVINHQAPSEANRQAYLTVLASRGSSASSTLSNYSTTTGESNSTETSSNDKPMNGTCFRCNKSIESTNDKISMGESSLHLRCLTCASCCLTLRTSEIHYYLESLREEGDLDEKKFYCSICRPCIKTQVTNNVAANQASTESDARTTVRSREDFLNEKINYNELYRNLIDKNLPAGVIQTNRIESQTVSSRHLASKATVQSTSNPKSGRQTSAISPPSPVQITLPLNLITGRENSSNRDGIDKCSKIAKSETVEESEQVTLVLSDSSKQAVDSRDGYRSWPNRTMVDEDELERFHHPDQQSASTSKSIKERVDPSSSSSASSDSNKNGEMSESSDDDHSATQLPGDESSLNSSLDTGEYDANTDENSTNEDFLTSEEFGPLSDCEDQDNAGEVLSLDEPEDAISEPRKKVSVSEK